MRKQAYNRFRKLLVNQVERTQLVIPAFLLSAPTWAGASDLLQEYQIANDYYFSLLLPILSFGENFAFAVRWTDGDGVIRRFVLWVNDDAILYYPLYAGERIGPNAIFEVWSVNSESAPSLDDNQVLYTSVLTFPFEGCACDCATPEAVTTLAATAPSPLPPYAFCNPFCTDLC